MRRSSAIRNGLPLLTLLLGVLPLAGCGSGIQAVNYATSRSALEATRNISDQDVEDLRAGRLIAIRDRYDAVAAERRSVEQLSLLCDVRLKLQEFGRAQLCNETLAAEAARRGDEALRAKAKGRRALFALAQHRYADAAAELQGNDGEGARYVRALAQARQGQTEAAREVALAFSRQYKPRPVFYAASLYAAAGDCRQALRLLEDPERRLLADYGLTALRDGGTSVNRAPFRLDLFDEFSFGWFGDFSFAPAANVYVEVLAAQCLNDVGRTADAAERLNRLLAFPNLPAYRDVHWLALYLSGLAKRAAGQQDGALAMFRTAIDVVELSRSTILSESGRIAFAVDKQQLYGDLVDLLLRSGQKNQALEMVERAKSRVLVDMLASRDDFAPADLSGTEARRLLGQLGDAEASLSLIALRGEGNADAAEAAIRTANGRIRSRSSDLAPLVSALPRPFSELAAVLRPGEAGVVYYSVGDHWHAFVLSPAGTTTVDLGTPPVRTLVLKFREQLADPDSRDYADAARRLGDAVLAPVLAATTAKKLLIIPHGALHYIPFAALDDGHGPLVATRAIRTAPSLSALGQRSRQPGSPAPALAIGDSGRRGVIFGNPLRTEPGLELPGAEAEAKEVAKLYPASALFIGRDATVARFRDAVPGKSFLHIAAHGQFFPSNPLSSRLLLSAAPGGSGDLTVGDLYGLRIDVPLAVLSACQTGLSEVSPGDDLIGLVRGFLFSGVRGIVGSYWSVADESTTLLMLTFYNGLKAGAPSSEALQAAQLAVMRRYPHPFFWAPFAMMGEDTSL